MACIWADLAHTLASLEEGPAAVTGAAPRASGRGQTGQVASASTAGQHHLPALHAHRDCILPCACATATAAAWPIAMRGASAHQTA
jgi:hypothetical protein